MYDGTGTDKSVTDLIGGYMSEIEKLQSRLIESDQMYQQLKKQLNSPRNVKHSTVGTSGLHIIISKFIYFSKHFRSDQMKRNLSSIQPNVNWRKSVNC